MLIALLSLVLTAQAADLTGVKHSDPVPSELAAPVAAKLAPGGVRATASGATITFWWVADLPGASLSEVPEGTLIGAVKLDADGRDIRGRVLKAGDQIVLMTLPKETNSDELWKRFDRARFDVAVQACYCSVLDDCWIFDSTHTDPEPVRSCPALSAEEEWNG